VNDTRLELARSLGKTRAELTDFSEAVEAVRTLLRFIGEDVDREGLRDTPVRFLKAWAEWSKGYQLDPKGILKTFEDGAERCDEMVIVTNIPIISKCEHHLADITGWAHVGYIPNGKIVGLSKLARVADLYARRLQVQERLTNQIADALVDGLNPKGVGVVVKAAHACMSSRGVSIQGSLTVTSAMRGALLEKPAARAEFLSLCESAEKHK
jgi:GTP cyclohydrolase I